MAIEVKSHQVRRNASEDDLLKIMQDVALISDRIDKAVGESSEGLEKVATCWGNSQEKEEPESLHQSQLVSAVPACDSALNSRERALQNVTQPGFWRIYGVLKSWGPSLTGAILVAVVVLTSNTVESPREYVLMLTISLITGALTGPVIFSLMTDQD